MIVSNNQSSSPLIVGNVQSATQQTASNGNSGSFGATLASLGSGTCRSDEDIRCFFLTNPSNSAIATQAAAMRLNEDQIVQAMAVGGFGGDDVGALRNSIESFVSSSGGGYSWDAGGTLTATPSTSAKTAALSATDRQWTVADLDRSVLRQIQSQGLDSRTMNVDRLNMLYQNTATALGINANMGTANACYWSPTQSRSITPDELKSFAASSPSDAQIFQKASELGLNLDDVHSMMKSLAMPTADSYYGSAFNRLNTSLSQSREGFSTDSLGHIVANGGGLSTAGSKTSALAATEALGTVADLDRSVLRQIRALGLDPKTMSVSRLNALYQNTANALGLNANMGTVGASYWSPALSRSVTADELKAFTASNPSDTQIFQKASELGLDLDDVQSMMKSQGMPGGDSYYGSAFNRMDTSLYQGRNGFTRDAAGHIVSGTGDLAGPAAGSKINTTA